MTGDEGRLKRLLEWDSLEIRVDGRRLSDMVAQMLRGMEPIERMELEFRNSHLRVTGTIRKFIAVPFSVEVTEMHARGTTVRIPLRSISAAGLPIPSILFGLMRSRLPKDLVTYEEPATLVLSLDRFLPSFVSADVQKIWIIDGGLAVTLGKGGADLPEPPIPGGAHDRNHHHDHSRDSEREIAGD